MNCTSSVFGKIGHLFSISFLAFVLVGCEAEQTATAVHQPSPAAPADLFSADISGARVLVFSKTGGWRHESIPAGIEALQKLAYENAFEMVATEDANVFNDARLSEFNAIVFLNTWRDVLDRDQELAMERFIQAGGGFVGIHSAADTEWEGDWYWYRKLVGAVFKSHPEEPASVQKARLNVVDHNHSATVELPETFELIDEWYDYYDLNPFRNDLLTLDEKSYMGGQQGEYHPITWYHDFDGGRSFYTGLGHTSEMYSDEYFLNLLLKGLRYAVGGKPVLDYTKARPEGNRFIKKTLVENLDEPMSFDFFRNGDALIAERPGTLQRVIKETGEKIAAGKIEVAYNSTNEIGLLGVALDQQFETNKWIYVTYNHQGADGQLWQRLARFNWNEKKVDNASEKILLAYKIDDSCCHTGGDLQWGENGELFVSTGDNTNPHDQQGYAPIDARDDHAHDDALRGAGNTQDFRGKILRIIPQSDGTYTIPKGNLFADASEGLPEIYVMGARNPFTITYDKTTSALFYGDVGPDANQTTTERGTAGYDEINRVTAPGNFGWPLFVGNNRPYVEYDFDTATSGKMFNPLAPVNNSPRNTGAKQLPPAQPALLWYPYSRSEEFPELGSGGRTAMVADVYRSESYPASPNRYPDYYDGKLFILDFMRAWVKAVTIDEFGRVQKIEPFAPQINYTLPIDARFAPDGTLYVLEYGSSWFTGNPDASLVRIEYVGAGNRPPEAAITLAAKQGSAPMQVVASGLSSSDPDGDPMTYVWSLTGNDGTVDFTGSEPEFGAALEQAGTYFLRLEVRDLDGASATAEAQIDVGNAPASIAIDVEGNSSFYWPDSKAIKYAVTINDTEDGVIAAGQGDMHTAQISFNYIAPEPTVAAGHQTAGAALIGKDLFAANGCGACHQMTDKSVGPAFRAVADRYKNSSDAVQYLVKKIGEGSSGVWGESPMPGFAHLTEEDRSALAAYVLSNATQAPVASLPLSGEVQLTRHEFSAEDFASVEPPKELPESTYEFTATYTDKGGDAIGPITVEQRLQLSPARLFFQNIFRAESSDESVSRGGLGPFKTLRADSGVGQWQVAALGDFDLSELKFAKVGYIVIRAEAKWEVELRVDEPDGRAIARGEHTHMNSYYQLDLPFEPTAGKKPLFIAIRSASQPDSDIHLVDISFQK